MHVFGAVSSQSCANYALKRIAYDNEKVIDKDTYDSILRQF